MSKKIDLDSLQMILSDETSPESARKIIAAAQKLLEEEAAEKEEAKGAKLKFEYTVLVTEDQWDKPVSEASLFIAKVPTDSDVGMVHATMRLAAMEFNKSKKAKKHPIRSFIDAVRTLKPKFFAGDLTRSDIYQKKEFKIVANEPVRAVAIPNHEFFAE